MTGCLWNHQFSLRSHFSCATVVGHELASTHACLRRTCQTAEKQCEQAFSSFYSHLNFLSVKREVSSSADAPFLVPCVQMGGACFYTSLQRRTKPHLQRRDEGYSVGSTSLWELNQPRLAAQSYILLLEVLGSRHVGCCSCLLSVATAVPSRSRLNSVVEAFSLLFLLLLNSDQCKHQIVCKREQDEEVRPPMD